MKKIALSAASALLIVVVSGGVATAQAVSAESGSASAAGQDIRPLTNGWE